MKVPIDKILIGERTRSVPTTRNIYATDDFRASLERIGLIQPIAVEALADGNYLLLAGLRRLTAARGLGWTEIEARVYEESLTATGRLEVELEENDQRHDFTPFERSVHLARIAEVARAAALEDPTPPGADSEGDDPEGELREAPAHNSRGRPREPGSYRDLERRTGIRESNFRLADQHLAAVAKYPKLRNVSAYDAGRYADALDSLPPEERGGWEGRLWSRGKELLELVRQREADRDQASIDRLGEAMARAEAEAPETEQRRRTRERIRHRFREQRNALRKAMSSDAFELIFTVAEDGDIDDVKGLISSTGYFLRQLEKRYAQATTAKLRVVGGGD